MYERRQHPLISMRAFLGRIAMHLVFAVSFALVSLGVGMLGYMHYEHLEWRDAFLNAAMLLGGMGPVNPPVAPDGKIFAGVYALYAGLVFLFGIAIVLAPVLHRVLHTFHADEDE